MAGWQAEGCQDAPVKEPPIIQVAGWSQKIKNVALFFPLPEIASFAVEELRSSVEGYIIRCLFVVGA